MRIGEGDVADDRGDRAWAESDRGDRSAARVAHHLLALNSMAVVGRLSPLRDPTTCRALSPPTTVALRVFFCAFYALDRYAGVPLRRYAHDRYAASSRAPAP